MVIAAAIALAGALSGKSLLLALETAIALAVATVPEGLPIIATLALARGMHRMVRKNALVNRLSAVETLGATNILCADKTGTLTENRMSVEQIVLVDKTIHIDAFPSQNTNASLRQVLTIGALCNNASLDHEEEVGDPLEIALLRAIAPTDLNLETLATQHPRCQEHAFDSDLKMMATVHRTNAAQLSPTPSYLVAVKGAPESVLASSTQELTDGEKTTLTQQGRQNWTEHARRLASEGLRVIAAAYKYVEDKNCLPYQGLTLAGLIALLDPPRKDVEKAVAECHKAGIRLIMITGDHPDTARNIAQRVGIAKKGKAPVMLGEALETRDVTAIRADDPILATDIFARVSPKQKLSLITLHQKQGAIVAMTGDGVNDAPALKKADIGIAMGLRGTDVAREAADLVLQDDQLATITYAVAQGRTIFANIRNFVVYLLSCNLSEVLVISLATLVGAPLPLLPLQILFLNLVTDVFPALALGAGEGESSVMERPPRPPKQAIITRNHWRQIVFYGLTITAATLAAFAIALGPMALPTNAAVTVAFLTLAFAQLWHVWNLRRSDSGLFRNEITKNPFMWFALLLCCVFLWSAVYFTPMAAVLQTVSPNQQSWLLIGVCSIFPVAWWQTIAVIRRWKKKP